MGNVLQRHLGAVTSMQPGQWTAETMSGEPAICCPKCSCISDLEPKRVQTGGVVRYLWQCPAVSCSFTSFLVLEAWGEDVVPA